MNTTIVNEALTYDIAIALSCTRWKLLFHLPTHLALSEYGVSFLNDIEDPFYLIQFVHATMITLSEDVEDSTEFEFFGKDYFKQEFTNIFELNTTDQDTPEYKFGQALLQLVDKVYDYFTTPYVGSKELKQAFLNSSNIEDTIYELKPDYTSDEDKQIIALMQVVVNQGDETLSAFKDLTVDANWKHIILSHYNFEAIEYPSFTEAYPETEKEKDNPSINDLKSLSKDSVFQKLDESELPTMDIDLFDTIKLKRECLDDFFERNRKMAGYTSKQNHKVAITIKNIETNETKTFNSSDECAKFLNLSKRNMIRFKKGTTKLNKIWQVVDEQESDTSL